MSKKWSPIVSLAFMAIAWGIAGFVVAYTGLFSESSNEAFVRGYFHGAYYAVGVMDNKFNQGGEIVASFRECLIEDGDASWQEWLEEIDRESISDSTDTMPAVEADDEVDWDTIPFNEPLTDSALKAKMESLGWWDETDDTIPTLHPDSIDTMPVNRGVGVWITPAMVKATTLIFTPWPEQVDKNFMRIILPDTGGQ